MYILSTKYPLFPKATSTSTVNQTGVVSHRLRLPWQAILSSVFPLFPNANPVAECNELGYIYEDVLRGMLAGHPD